MKATFCLSKNNLTVVGQHKPGVPRFWTITCRAESHCGRVEIDNIRTKRKYTLADLHDVVHDHFRMFYERWGEPKEIIWTAIAR